MADVNVPQIQSNFRPVGDLIKPIQQTGGFGNMSIGDIVNMGATMQAYEKQKELMPYQIEAGKAQSQTAQTQAENAALELTQLKQNIVRGSFGGLLKDERLISGDKEGTLQALYETQKELTDLGIQPPDEGKGFQELVNLAQTDPKRLYQVIKNNVERGGGVANQYSSIQSSQNVPIYAGQGAPQGAPQNAPTGVTPEQMGQPKGAQGNKFGGEALPYPVRQPGIQFNPGPSEAADEKVGFAYRTDLRNKADAVPLNRRNIQEVLDVTGKLQSLGIPTYGKAADFNKSYSKFAGTDVGVLYAKLSKDLANAQISQMSENDLKTKAGQDLQAAASGTDVLPPEVLSSIARRQAAQNTALELQSNGAEKFANRFQDRNMKAFQKQWQSNADSKVFELISLRNSGLSREELAQEANKLLGTNPEARREFFKKYNNIQRLSETGSL